MKKRNTTKTKLVATIVSMVSALCLLAVGVFATLTNFQVAIANQLNLKFDAVEGTLYATRVGDVAGTDRTTSKVLSESSTATDWLKVYDGTTTEGVQNDALTSIQEKVDFISNDAIKAKVNAGTISIAITYYFYYTLPADAVANNITLTAPAVSDSNVVVSYSYIKTTSSTLPAFTDATTLNNGSVVTISGGEHLFIKAEAKVDLSKSVKIENANWNFTLNFGISKYTLTGDTLNFNAVSGAETYEVWAKETTTSGASLLAQTSAVGDTDATLGTLVKILDKSAISVNLAEALTSQETATYTITVLPKNSSGTEISGSRISVNYAHTKTASTVSVKVTDEAIGGNYYYYVELGEYPQTVVEDTTTLSALNSLGDSAKTGRTFVVGGSEDGYYDGSGKFNYYKINLIEYVYNNCKFTKYKDIGNSVHWYKVEPIKWMLLEAYSTNKSQYVGTTKNIHVVAEKILVSGVMFDASQNTWVNSNMRYWLNQHFYEEAFSVDDRQHILLNDTRYFGNNSHTEKDDYTVSTGGQISKDYVWNLSYYEVTNTFYQSNMFLNKTTRLAKMTNLAYYTGLNKLDYISGINGTAPWWLRTAGESDLASFDVFDDGRVVGDYDVFNNDEGIRPALTISL